MSMPRFWACGFVMADVRHHLCGGAAWQLHAQAVVAPPLPCGPHFRRRSCQAAVCAAHTLQSVLHVDCCPGAVLTLCI